MKKMFRSNTLEFGGGLVMGKDTLDMTKNRRPFSLVR